MRFVIQGLAVALVAGVAAGLTLPAYANGSTPHPRRHAHVGVHGKVVAPVHRHPHMHVHPRMRAVAYPYTYGYVPDYAYYVPTRVFRCYPARQMVEDQVGLVVGYVQLGTCG